MNKADAPADGVAALLKASTMGVGIGDEVFFDHPKHGLTSGKVLAYGADGFMAERDGARHGVLWDAWRGHKKRAERTYHVVESGESGSIVEDPETGKRHFLAGEAPDPDDDQELLDERDMILGLNNAKS